MKNDLSKNKNVNPTARLFDFISKKSKRDLELLKKYYTVDNSIFINYREEVMKRFGLNEESK